MVPRQAPEQSGRQWPSAFRLTGFTLIGLCVFFLPVTLNGTTTIPLDHAVSWLRASVSTEVEVFVLAVIIAGGVMPFVNGRWGTTPLQVALALLRLSGIAAAFMAFSDTGPALLLADDMVPFLFDKLVVPVGLIVPLGAVFIPFVIGYGFLDLVGRAMQPIMRPLFGTPGKSAIDALASFVGSYSLGLLITNRVYAQGVYSAREAAIIATGFSTVSASFMVIVARTLGLMEVWNGFFWSTLAVTFTVTAITARLSPLKDVSNNRSGPGTNAAAEDRPREAAEDAWEERGGTALRQALTAARLAPGITEAIASSLRQGLLMAMNILPTIMSVGLIGLLLAKHTPCFDVIGYLFYPLTWLLPLADPALTAKAAATGLAEMFLPALLAQDSDFTTRFLIGQLSISAILFFSASIPCILATAIPLSPGQLTIIWYQRTALTLILGTPMALFFAGTAAA